MMNCEMGHELFIIGSNNTKIVVHEPRFEDDTKPFTFISFFYLLITMLLVLVRKEIAPIVAMLIGQYSLLLCATLLGVIMCWCIPPPGGSDNTMMNRIYVIWLLGFIMMVIFDSWPQTHNLPYT